jgi:hypothetical protein
LKTFQGSLSAPEVPAIYYIAADGTILGFSLGEIRDELLNKK